MALSFAGRFSVTTKMPSVRSEISTGSLTACSLLFID
jgi:hypothetical protein